MKSFAIFACAPLAPLRFTPLSASCSGVAPSPPAATASGAAPLSTSSLHIRSWPVRAAMCSGVSPSDPPVFSTLAPCANRNRVSAPLRAATASCSGGIEPDVPVSSTSYLPALISIASVAMWACAALASSRSPAISPRWSFPPDAHASTGVDPPPSNALGLAPCSTSTCATARSPARHA